MVGKSLTARPPDEFQPNQAHLTLPMVCGWRPCTQLGHSHATDQAIC
jgi:hypothetical protein